MLLLADCLVGCGLGERLWLTVDCSVSFGPGQQLFSFNFFAVVSRRHAVESLPELASRVEFP